MTSPEVSERREGHSWGANECCQCHERGAVWNEHYPCNREMSAPTPIIWVCVGCDQHVCINCVLTIANSHPVEIRCPTFCSEDCRTRWKAKIKLTGEDYLDEDDED